MAANTMIDAPRSEEDRTNGSGRQVLGAVVAGLGALIFTVAGLVHFYVVPALAVAPVDQNSVTSLEAKGATIFDTATLAPITTDLSIKARTVGDVSASDKAPDGVRVWVGTTTITSSDGVIRSQSVKRSPFNEKTAEAVNCCGAFNETEQGVRTPVKRTGLVWKFPFNTEKKTYQVWDDTAGKAVTTKYTGTAKILGHTAWIFQNDVPDTVVGTKDLPASVLGLPGNDNVTADSHYQNHNTYYVEPVTGAIVNQVTDTKSWFSYQGHDLVATQAHLEYTPAQIRDMWDKELGSQPQQLSLAQGFVPWLLALLGLGMIAGGAALGRRRSA